jgi:hypothetical protein
MRRAATLLAMAGAMMAGMPEATSESRRKYPSLGGSTNHGKLLPGQMRKRKRLKRLENKARSKQQLENLKR